MPSSLSFGPMISKITDVCYTGSLSYEWSFRRSLLLEKVLGYLEVWNAVVLDLEYTTLGMEGLSSIGCQEAVFPATRGLVSCVWRTTDSKHYLATKDLESVGRYGQMLLIILVSLCGSKGQKEILTLTVFLDSSDTKEYVL